MIQRFRVFFLLVLRPMLHEPVRTALTVLAVALGVGVVLAIDLAGTAAAGSFQASMETLAGDASLEVTATGGVPDSVVGTLATAPYDIEVHPRIEDFATVVAAVRGVPLLGLDLVAGGLGQQVNVGSRTDYSNAVWVGRDLGLKVGDTVELQVNDRLHRHTVAGLLDPSAGDVIVMDISTAARDLARRDRVDTVLVKTPAQPGIEEWQRRISSLLPLGVSVRPAGSRTSENRRMLAAFRWNLRVLSYIALVVGAFLIYNTISVSVVRRRPEIGIVRALGAGRSGVLLAFLGEAAMFGLVGAAGGLLLGRLMAVGSVRLISSTVESLYVSSRPAPIEITTESVVLALIVGLTATTAAALSPALEAARVTPVEAMSRGQREYVAGVHKTRDLILAVMLGIGGALAWRGRPIAGKPLFGYLAALLLIGCSALAIPALVTALSRVSSRLLRTLLGVEALLASRSLAAALRRTSVLVGALSTAIAMVTAVGIMVGSFRQTVVIWMDNQLQADLYLRPAGSAAADRHPTIDPSLPLRIAVLPGVAAVDAFRAYEVSYGGLPATFGAGDAAIQMKYARTRFLSGRPASQVLPELIGRDRAIVSEPFANKHNIRRGDRIVLPLGEHRQAFTIADVYYDYANERGYVVVDRSTLLKYLPDPAVSNIAVYAQPGADLDSLRTEVERAAAGRRVMVLSNRSLKTDAIKVFDRTFAITYALEAVAILVAVMGIAGALLGLVIDRSREFGLLRFLGASTQQVRKLILIEAGLLGLLANIAGLLLGFVLSLLLMFVINKQSFGWTIQFHWPVLVLTAALTSVYAATILAGIYPARVATRLNPIEVVHEE